MQLYPQVLSDLIPVLDERRKAMDNEAGRQAIKEALLEVTEYATQHDEKGERLPLTL